MISNRISPKAWTLLLGLALIWGSAFTVTAVLLDSMSPLQLSAHRALWAAVFLWVWVIWRGLVLPRDLGTILATFVMGFGSAALPYLLQNYAQTQIESGLAGILNASTAIIGPVVAAALLADERMTRRKAVGVTLGFVGVAVVIGPGALRGLDLRSAAQLAALAASLSYALSSVWARKRLGGLRPEIAALGTFTGAALLLVPTAWAIEGPLPFALPGTTWAAMAYYGVAVTAGGSLIYYPLLRLAGAANTSLVTLLIVPIAVGLGAMVRHETLPPSAFAGFALIAAGLVVLDGRLDRKLFDRV